MKYHVIPVTSFNQNCTVVWCEISNEAMLVDPGGDINKLFIEIDKLHVKIVKIVLTHGHIDHVGGAEELKKYYNVAIVGPNENDRFLLNDLSLQYSMFDIHSSMNLKVIPDVWLQDGDCLFLGQEVFDVLHCPGHSPGHVVFFNKKSKFIIMGDVLFKKNVGRSDLPGGDFKTLMHSIRTKLLVLPDDIEFLPGHGPTSSIGFERKHNTYLK